MKNLSKLIAVVLTSSALLFASNVKAQTTPPPAAPSPTNTYDPFSLSIGLEVGIPTYVAHTASNIELGGTGQFQYRPVQSFAVTLTSGYYDIVGKTIPSQNLNYKGFQIVPVQAGPRFFLTENFYAGVEAGAGFVTTLHGNTKFLVAPGIGYATKYLDLGVRYEAITGQGYNYGFVGARLAYNFGL
jgi:hypothetical protein